MSVELRIGQACEGQVMTWGERGFGFIKVDGLRTTVFVHVSQLRNCSWLQPGDRLAFVVGIDPLTGRLQACECELLDTNVEDHT
jgi:cold shock CspA family protein